MADIYQAITDRILDSLEQGHLPGIGQPWDPSRRTPLIPCNAISGRPYSGINVPLLWTMVEQRKFSQDRWLTFRQAKEAGGTVRKGERSTLACFYKPMKREIDDDAGDPVLDEEGNPTAAAGSDGRGKTWMTSVFENALHPAAMFSTTSSAAGALAPRSSGGGRLPALHWNASIRGYQPGAPSSVR